MMPFFIARFINRWQLDLNPLFVYRWSRSLEINHAQLIALQVIADSYLDTNINADDNKVDEVVS